MKNYVTTNGLVNDSSYPFNARANSCNKSKTKNVVTKNKDVVTCDSTAEWTETTTDGDGNRSQRTFSNPCYEDDLYNLLVNGPVSVGLDASGLQDYTGGIFDSACSQVNHAVVLVGYGTDPESSTPYWVIRNSWNTNWGEDGYARIKRDSSNNNSCYVAAIYAQPTY